MIYDIFVINQIFANYASNNIQGTTRYEGVFGDKGGNNAGEYLSVDIDTGDIMVFTDSDTVGGFGFLKLTPF